MKMIVTTQKRKKRTDHEIEVSAEDATDPIKRASLISAMQARFDYTVVNWKFVE